MTILDQEKVALGLYRKIKIYNLADGSLDLDLEGHSDFVFCLDYSSKYKSICSGSKDLSIILWDK